jgi:hypothetical protein
MTHQQHAVAKCSGRACHAPKLTPCPLSLPKRTSRGRCWQASAILKVADCRSEDAEALLLPALSSYDPEVRWRLADALFAQEKLRGRDSTRCRTIRLRKAYRESAFYAGSGNDCRRALELARANAVNRPTRLAIKQVHAMEIRTSAMPTL